MSQTQRLGGRGGLALRSKMALVAGIPLVVVALAATALFFVGRTSERTADGIELVYRARAGIATVLRDLIDAETSARGYLLTGDSRFLQPYRVGAGSARGDLVRLRGMLGDDPATRATLGELDELLTRRLAILHQLIVYADRSNGAEVPGMLLAEGRRVSDRIRRSLGELDERQAKELGRRRDELARARRTSTFASVLVVPLTVGASILLVVAFTSRLVRRVQHIEHYARHLDSGPPIPDDAGRDEIGRLAETLAQTAARLAEQDAELRELALVDPLTGLHNRRAFLELAEHELEVCRRHGSETALFFVDVDGLKRVNDGRGHAAGDLLLKEAASALREATRSSDLVARIGGDEFCVLLARDGALDDAAVLQRLEIAGERNGDPETADSLSFSVGMAVFDPAAPLGVEELIERADRKMYQVKRAKASAASLR